MTIPIFDMENLQPCEAKLFLLEGRIRFRKAWAMRNHPDSNKPVTRKDEKWMREYDEEYNFAHIGARLVEPDWGGMPAPKKSARQPSRAHAVSP